MCRGIDGLLYNTGKAGIIGELGSMIRAFLRVARRSIGDPRCSRVGIGRGGEGGGTTISLFLFFLYAYFLWLKIARIGERLLEDKRKGWWREEKRKEEGKRGWRDVQM